MSARDYEAREVNRLLSDGTVTRFALKIEARDGQTSETRWLNLTRQDVENVRALFAGDGASVALIPGVSVGAYLSEIDGAVVVEIDTDPAVSPHAADGVPRMRVNVNDGHAVSLGGAYLAPDGTPAIAAGEHFGVTE